MAGRRSSAGARQGAGPRLAVRRAGRSLKRRQERGTGAIPSSNHASSHHNATHPASMPPTMKASFRLISSPCTRAGLVSAARHGGTTGAHTARRWCGREAARVLGLLRRPTCLAVQQKRRHAHPESAPPRCCRHQPTCDVGGSGMHCEADADAIQQPARQHRGQAGRERHHQRSHACSRRASRWVGHAARCVGAGSCCGV